MFTSGSDILLPAWMILLCALLVGGLVAVWDARDVGFGGVRARGVALVAWCLVGLRAVVVLDVPGG